MEVGISSRFIFYGGKGGVGKTTCAAARALHEAAAGANTLLVSTDPAHSIADALGTRLSATPRRVAPRLDALELNAVRALARWLDDNRHALADALEHGTWLTHEDAEALLELPVPGVDELVGLLEIARLAGGYDTVVVDTAPTGHALRLMAAPETVAAAADVLDALQADHRIVREQLARVSRPEPADRVIALIAQQARDASQLLRDPRRTSFHWVTLPEQLAAAESEDGIAALTHHGIPVSEIVINRVIPPGKDAAPCPTCDPRRAEERRVMQAIMRSVGKGRAIRVVPAELTEPRGSRALRAIGRHLIARPDLRYLAAKPARPARTTAAAHLPAHASQISTAAIDAVQDAELVFVGGKGGVGKTTVAAAIAITLAHDAPDRSILLLSTDPAHSVADVLNSPLGDDVRPVRGAPANLVARELDAARAFALRRDAFTDADDNLQLDRLLALAPPGVDELFGMLSLVDALAANDTPGSSRRRRTVIVDTAPTGHALRLLEMPDTVREWVQLLLRLLMKYRQIAKPGRLAAELVDVSRSIRELQALLHDRRRTRFIVVTRAAAVPRAETLRLMTRLRSLSIATSAIVANARTLEPRQCRRCRSAAAAERTEMAALGRAARRCAIIETPLVAPPPRGAADLYAWARTWVPRHASRA